MSKRILIMPDGNWLSHTSRALEIAKVLRETGHEVIFAIDGPYTRLAQENGFEIITIQTIDPERILACSRDSRTNWYEYDFIKTSVEAELKLFDELRPNLVLMDFRLTLSISCELANIPLAVILNTSWTNFYTVNHGAPESHGLSKIFDKSITDQYASLLRKKILERDNRPFNKFRKEVGLPPRENILDTWRGDLNLLADLPEYGPTENLPGHYKYIGPIVWEPEIELPDWYESLDPQKPTLYFSMGSTGFKRFFDQAVEIFKNSDYQCIMTTAGMVKIPDVPDNFFVVDYAPGSKIMEISDVVICHGGNGTVYQAMIQGTPIIGIPTMHDQEFNLDRVESLGIGIRLSEVNYQPEHLEAAVKKVLAEKHFKENALRFKNMLKDFNGPLAGAQLIDAFLHGNPLPDTKVIKARKASVATV
ncbi:MAG: glycosyltransferase [Saprospiraceae bacterium]|nr:glycosyltransferase [Saprospiraceae bacterium]MCB9325755.1 glycosyltransferase [Lewinellaceae bacterium]